MHNILTNRGNYSFEKYLDMDLCVTTLHCEVIVLRYHMQIDQSPRLRFYLHLNEWRVWEGD